jgi:hypothetical protein
MLALRGRQDPSRRVLTHCANSIISLANSDGQITPVGVLGCFTQEWVKAAPANSARVVVAPDNFHILDFRGA